jgi:hypothetical protein
LSGVGFGVPFVVLGELLGLGQDVLGGSFDVNIIC